jgi:hypothetical protein
LPDAAPAPEAPKAETPETGAAEPLSEPVTAMGTQDLLAAQMADLQAMLSG